MRSIPGHCIFCFLSGFGNLVQWSSKRQTLTAGSTKQAELVAASSAADATVWYFTLQGHSPVLFCLTGKPVPVPLLIDDEACLGVTPPNHPMSSPRTRHICICGFRIRDYAEAGEIRPYWIPGTHNVADHFTKLLVARGHCSDVCLGPLAWRTTASQDDFLSYSLRAINLSVHEATQRNFVFTQETMSQSGIPTQQCQIPRLIRAAWIYYNLHPGEFPPGYVNCQ